jgi:hypothetical protein
MDIVGGGDALDIALEIGEIRRENGGGDLDHDEKPSFLLLRTGKAAAA